MRSRKRGRRSCRRRERRRWKVNKWGGKDHDEVWNRSR